MSHPQSRGNDYWHRFFLGLAEYVASASKDPSTKVGACIAEPNHHIVSTGCNGFPSVMPDRNEWYADRAEKYERIIHAEVNALLFATTPLPRGCVLYTWPFLPCNRCIVQTLQAGIMHYVAPVSSQDAIERWGEAFERTRRYIKECGGTLLELET